LLEIGENVFHCRLAGSAIVPVVSLTCDVGGGSLMRVNGWRKECRKEKRAGNEKTMASFDFGNSVASFEKSFPDISRNGCVGEHMGD